MTPGKSSNDSKSADDASRRSAGSGSGPRPTRGVRAALLRFAEDGHAIYDEDGLLVIGVDVSGREVVVAAGDHQSLAPLWRALPIAHHPGRILAPGFVDLHIHFPQTDVIGSPAEGLLPWLEEHTFPHEAKFADRAYADTIAPVFLDELQRNGVTTALVFGSSHPESVDALMTEAQRRGLRLVAGKSLQDRNSPDGVRDRTEQSLVDTEALIHRWHGNGRLGYAITPRFAPSCSEAQLRGAGELAAAYPGVWIQSHVAENLDEIRWARELFPASRSYLATYDDFGLMRSRSIYAHCIHFDDEDRARMRSTGAAAAVCPTSNFFLGSGFFDFAGAMRCGCKHGLGSDVGGGTSFSPFRTMLAAYEAAREGQTKPAVTLSPERLWWLHTAGAAEAMGLKGVVGNLAPGCEADYLLLDPRATPLLERRTSQARDLGELLFALIVLGDDRCVYKTSISNQIAEEPRRNGLV